ncbi:MAG: Eco57I restriction-modification methylase domain-containing protein [Candidatus Pacebacteria bacterium]|nr:Eco57I restriction-modification methylase domain-containing protein [Candidatus Paceibacterota bacterium]
MQNNYNPDVLSCLANLSSDEVFTPPKLANEILDLLPKEIWKDKTATFLDPVCKSGVFLREIAKRLLEGLKNEIPDLQKRIDHIYSKQIFGIGITELTSLLSRRSLYCSKIANGKYSVSGSFNNDQGNIFFEKTDHDWKNGRCSFCGASQSEYQREEGLETHAYKFIHNKKPNVINNMKFDVIIGNPPYQLSDQGDSKDGARQRGGAIPVYHLFVQQARKMQPRFLVMITPSRWFSGGRGLDVYRQEMLQDGRISHLVDYPVSGECFPGVEIKGGVSYFLWERDHLGDCEVKTVRGNNVSILRRTLIEKGSDIFVRFNESIEILKKVLLKKEQSFSNFVSNQKPFGLRTFFEGEKRETKDSFKIYTNKGCGFVKNRDITQNLDWIDEHKVYISMAYGAGEDFPHQIINKPFYGEPGTCCTETYLVIGPFESKKIAENVISYMRTRFFRFLVMLRKNTQHASRGVYTFVPIQNFSESWTDEKLYKKYKLTKKEIAFIESMIRPMN